MNVKEYISSGIIESYVMGLVTETERKEFESLCIQYPEIAEARNAFELALEQQLLSDAKQPPQHLRQLIEEKRLNVASSADTDELEEERTPVRTIGPWKWLAAASFILLIGAAYWAFNANNKYQEVLAQKEDLQKKLEQSTEQSNIVQAQIDSLKHPMKMASLKGTSIAPEAQAIVFWDTASTKDVFLVVNNLPAPASDKQYQLWALLNGKPIDLGVFDMDIQQKRLFVRMKNVQNAQAFAITLEPKGGSASPTLNSMYVMGSL